MRKFPEGIHLGADLCEVCNKRGLCDNMSCSDCLFEPGTDIKLTLTATLPPSEPIILEDTE